MRCFSRFESYDCKMNRQETQHIDSWNYITYQVPVLWQNPSRNYPISKENRSRVRSEN